MRDHFLQIYREQAAAYHHMTAAEDVDGNIPALLARLLPDQTHLLLDVGTGTGRIPLLLARQPLHVIGLDLHMHMLRQSQAEREQTRAHWSLLQGNVSRLPFSAAAFDAVTAGWSLGHSVGWFPQTWTAVITTALREMQRICRPGGVLIIFETLGTGAESPAPPTSGLATYYRLLEEEWGFEREQIRTDFQFESTVAASNSMAFFFGPELADRIRQNDWARVPEWTGVWHRRAPDGKS